MGGAASRDIESNPRKRGTRQKVGWVNGTPMAPGRQQTHGSDNLKKHPASRGSARVGRIEPKTKTNHQGRRPEATRRPGNRLWLS